MFTSRRSPEPVARSSAAQKACVARGNRSPSRAIPRYPASCSAVSRGSSAKVEVELVHHGRVAEMRVGIGEAEGASRAGRSERALTRATDARSCRGSCR
jgi:outer membrane biosynthesis protein TonB